MKKITYPWIKIGGFVLFGILVLLSSYLGVGCIFRRVFGFPCPGCGMTRACMNVFRLDFGAALRYHPMVWSVPFLAAAIWKDGKLFSSRIWNGVFWGVVSAGFLVAYAVRLYFYCHGIEIGL